MNGKVVYPTEYIKYLGIYLDETLSGKTDYCDELTKKPCRIKTLCLFKAVERYLLCDLPFKHGSQICGGSINTCIDKISII